MSIVFSVRSIPAAAIHRENNIPRLNLALFRDFGFFTSPCDLALFREFRFSLQIEQFRRLFTRVLATHIIVQTEVKIIIVLSGSASIAVAVKAKAGPPEMVDLRGILRHG